MNLRRPVLIHETHLDLPGQHRAKRLQRTGGLTSRSHRKVTITISNHRPRHHLLSCSRTASPLGLLLLLGTAFLLLGSPSLPTLTIPFPLGLVGLLSTIGGQQASEKLSHGPLLPSKSLELQLVKATISKEAPQEGVRLEALSWNINKSACFNDSWAVRFKAACTSGFCFTQYSRFRRASSKPPSW